VPKFYIHVQNGNGFEFDHDGMELADMESAKREALHAGADIIAQDLKGGCDAVNVTLFIEDDDHTPLLTLPLTAAVNPARHPR
jgi:hypothetical protein